MTIIEAVKAIRLEQGLHRGLGCVSLTTCRDHTISLDDEYAYGPVWATSYKENGEINWRMPIKNVSPALSIVSWSWSCDESGALYY